MSDTDTPNPSDMMKEKGLRALLDNISDMVQCVLPDGRVSYVNSTWCRTVGFNGGDRSLLHFTDGVHSAYRREYEALFQNALNSKQSQHVEVVIRSAMDEQIVVRGEMKPIVENSEILCVQIILQDMGELAKVKSDSKHLEVLRDTLIRSTLLISENLDLNVTLRRTIQSARKLAGADYAAIAVVENGKVSRFITEGMSNETIAGILQCPPRKGLISAIIQNPEILMLDDIHSDQRSVGFPEGHPEMGAYIGAPVIFAGTLHGVIYLTKKVEGDRFSYLDYSIIQNFAAHAAVAIHNAMLHQQLKEGSFETIALLARASEYRDKDTGEHIKRMSHYSAAIAQGLGLDDNYIETIKHAAAMHDVGKIGTPDKVLLKPGRLDKQEWEIMKQHTVFGANILKDGKNDVLKMAEAIALTHQEKYNGSGYPAGLSGEEIPLAGRIVAVADVFDALTMQRPYKPAFTVGKSFRIMKEGRGIHFDPRVLDAFFQIQAEILHIKDLYVDDELEQ